MPRGSIDKLDIDPHPIARPLNASLQHISHPQLPAHVLDFRGFSLVGERGVAGNHKQLWDLGEGGNDFLGQAITEILLLGIAAYVDKWQHGNGRLVRQRERHPLL